MEGVLAAFAQFDNDVRSDSTRAGMRAALELGRWTFLAPLGYMNAPRAMDKSLIPDPERAPLVRRAFQDFATGRFTKEEIRKSITGRGLKTRRGLPLPPQTFDRMLRNKVYIGQIDVPAYGVSTRGGRAQAEGDSAKARPFGTKRSFTSGQSTSTRTIGTVTNCARSSRSRRWIGTPASSKKWT